MLASNPASFFLFFFGMGKREAGFEASVCVCQCEELTMPITMTVTDITGSFSNAVNIGTTITSPSESILALLIFCTLFIFSCFLYIIMIVLQIIGGGGGGGGGAGV